MRYGYSAALLINNKDRQSELKSNRSCLGFAPLYKPEEKENPNRLSFKQLTETGKEIDAISSYYRGHYENTSAATVAAFRQKATDHGILHLAMHGQADYEQPDFAYLVFSNINEGEHQLYNYEISQMDLQAHLAVLSACETGIGQYNAGEGIFSLARGFMMGGVPSVVMSLWQVNDQSTSLLMPFFYKYLAAGLSKEEALHRAKLDFIESTAPNQRHPYYWAGFVLLGDEAPMESKGGIWFYLVGLGVILFSGGGWFLYQKRNA